MSEFFVRGFGDLKNGTGGIAWNLPAGVGGVMLDGAQASVAEVGAVPDEPDRRWTFYTPLEDDLLEGAAILRHIVVETSDGVIVCTASGPEGISGHSEEISKGARSGVGEDVAFEEALISTQYDADGDPTRFGLELWPEDADQTSRAAATRTSGTLLGGTRNGNTWAGLFRCHTDGFEGHGSYLLWRA